MQFGFISVIVISLTACSEESSKEIPKAKSAETSEDPQGFSESSKEGDIVTVEGQITYAEGGTAPGELYGDTQYTIITDANGEEAYDITHSANETLMIGDDVKVTGEYLGVNTGMEIPAIDGSKVEVINYNNGVVTIYDEDLESNADYSKDITIENEVFFNTEAEFFVDSDETVYFAELKNNGSEPLDISSVSITWYDNDDNVSMVTDSSIEVFPTVIEPGEKGYISYSDVTSGVKDLKNTELNLTPYASYSSTEELKVENDHFEAKTDSWDESYVHILGEITNQSETPLYNHTVYSVFRDENGNFLGLDSTSGDTTLQPNQTSGFEISGEDLPKEQIEKIDSVENSAYADTFDY